MAIFRTPIKSNPRKKAVSGNTLYHVKFADDENHYFGSIAAIFDKFTPERMGVSKSRVWSFGITPERPYRNKVCTVYKGEIHRKKGNRVKPR
jgi:hypothetical protein